MDQVFGEALSEVVQLPAFAVVIEVEHGDAGWGRRRAGFDSRSRLLRVAIQQKARR